MPAKEPAFPEEIRHYPVRFFSLQTEMLIGGTIQTFHHIIQKIFIQLVLVTYYRHRRVLIRLVEIFPPFFISTRHPRFAWIMIRFADWHDCRKS